MSRKVILVVPEAPPVQAAAGAAQRRLSTDGVRLGILDNSKGNADHLLKLVVEGMRATDVPITSVVSLRKGSVSLPAPAEMLDQLTREAGVLSALHAGRRGDVRGAAQSLRGAGDDAPVRAARHRERPRRAGTAHQLRPQCVRTRHALQRHDRARHTPRAHQHRRRDARRRGHVHLPLGKFSRENIERRFRITFRERYATAGPDAPVYAVQRAEDILIVVIGGAGKHSAYIPTFGATRAVTRALKRRDGSYARSVADFKSR